MTELIIYSLDLFGVAVLSASATLAARGKGIDLFGVIVLALVTSVGGGTFRDLVLGNTPVFWVRNDIYVFVVLASVILTMSFANHIHRKRQWLLYMDAIGLATFNLIGIQVAQSLDASPTICIIMGVMTGTVGGMIRDVLTNDIPLVLREEIYALTAIAGGVSYFATESLLDEEWRILLTLSITCVLRVIAIRKHLSLPTFTSKH
ncbi:trimeric intracellular cation channel family protein [Litoribrevibacter albus]|uniref:Membrane protein n=1 Tax=Litoribrevibacter albus TaxID=1473156 RepID=A0AA37SFD7_9GAMM|nr:trimeric intracellular cation channel family protein [Litoribrevibacter albus]GLQ33034.1 membrane protein [Litoribrevibacter albus]